MEQTLQDRIRERAYHLWNNGSGQGDETYFWVMAGREVSAEIAAESLLASASPETAQPVQSAPPSSALNGSPTLVPTDTEMMTQGKPMPAAPGKSRARRISAKQSAKV